MDFIERKAQNSETVAKWSTSNLASIRSKIKSALCDAGLAKRNGDNLLIQRPIVDDGLRKLSNSIDKAREKAAYRKEVDVLLAKIDECRAYDQVVSHTAHQQIELDLDDGVKVNYEKFQGVKVPIDGGKSVSMDLLEKSNNDFSRFVWKSAESVCNIELVT